MESIVLDLQRELTSSDCDIVNVLRKAHLIAAKLGLKEFDEWIGNELNGYSSEKQVPAYRNIRCILQMSNLNHDLMPVIFPNPELERKISEKYITQSISEILTLINIGKDDLKMNCNGAELKAFNKACNNVIPMQFKYHVPVASVAGIIEKVKNTLLEWTLKLEKEGIVGKNMIFSDSEKEQAKSVPQTVNNYYGNTNIVHGSMEHSQIVAGNENNLSISVGELNTDLDKIAEKIRNESGLSPENIETALELLADIRSKIDSGKKPGIIKSALVGLKDFLITAGGGLAANLLPQLIDKL